MGVAWNGAEELLVSMELSCQAKIFATLHSAGLEIKTKEARDPLSKYSWYFTSMVFNLGRVIGSC